MFCGAYGKSYRTKKDFVRFPEDERCYRTIYFRDYENNALYNDRMELKILGLKELLKDVKTGEDIVNWMRFFKGKSRRIYKV